MLAIGLEPITPKRTDFKSVVFTNFTKRAYYYYLFLYQRVKTLLKRFTVYNLEEELHPIGLEPITDGLEGRCSIQLS